MLEFSKLVASGNDFVVVDNRSGFIEEEHKSRIARLLCRRKMGVGADGLILVETSNEADFRMRIFNPDGSEAEMCGNGARCAAVFARKKGIVDSTSMRFATGAGTVTARVSDTLRSAEIGMTDVEGVEEVILEQGGNKLHLYFLDTGVPHAVTIVDSVNEVDVEKTGRFVRYHDHFQPSGTNVDFMEVAGETTIKIRTYERGVEGETLSCGTGSTAAAIVHAHVNGTEGPVEVHTRSGEVLRVSFMRKGGGFTQVKLEGRVEWVYDGVIPSLPSDEAR